jgi:hypothetical protein
MFSFRLLIVAILALASHVANAADSTVNALTAAGTLGGTELTYCVQGGADRKCTATQIGAFANGVFNVRTQYSGNPNGIASNNTPINNAFTAANAFVSGIPTVYFDCDTSQTTCVYNYSGLTGGGGLSPAQMLVPMTILCAPGVTLNYTGTTHAVEMGPTGLTADQSDIYLITGCRFTDGASMTAGIFVNNFIVHPRVIGNYFRNFGNQTGYTISYAGPNNWEPWIINNVWTDSDGFTKNMVDLHSATFSSGLVFADNMVECETVGGTACSVATTGVGVWAVGGRIDRNVIQYHYPVIRVASAGGNPLWITNNHLEGNSNGTGPAISYGDPGTAGADIKYIRVANNMVFWPVAANTNVFIGPESASSGSHQFSSSTVMNNFIGDLGSMSGSGKVIQTNGGAHGASFYFGNVFNNIVADQSTANFIDSAQQTANGWTVYNLGGTKLANNMPVFDANGVNVDIGSFHSITGPLLCADSSGSTTVKACNTSPKIDVAGSTFTPATGDCFTITSTTGMTTAGTLAVNGTTAHPVKITGGSADPSSGAKAILAGGYYPTCFDGTNYQVTLGQ